MSNKMLKDLIDDIRRVLPVAEEYSKENEILHGIEAVTIPFTFEDSCQSMKLLKGSNRCRFESKTISKEINNRFQKANGTTKINKSELLAIMLKVPFALSNYCIDTPLDADTTHSTMLFKDDDFIGVVSCISGLSFGGVYIYTVDVMKRLDDGRLMLTVLKPVIEEADGDDRYIPHVNFSKKLNTDKEFINQILNKSLLSIIVSWYINDTILDKRVLRRKRTRVNEATGEREYVSPPKKKEYSLKDLSTKIVYMDDTVNPLPKKEYTRHTDGWEVSGHTRTYKSGKTIWIKPFDKGEKKDEGKVIKL